MGTFFALPDGKVVCFNPGGRWHGWLFRRHPDGQFVSERKLEEITPPRDSWFDARREFNGGDTPPI